MDPSETIYAEYGIPTVVNGAGMKTRVGGTLMREEAVAAMSDAADAFARISDLQVKASEVIAEATGAEAGYVASGAAACLTLAAAATMAETDPGAMAALPSTEHLPDEIVVPRTHRTGYDRAFRNAGATIVDVGTNDRHLGTGSQDVEHWEIADAIGENTAAVGYVEKPYMPPDLETVVDVAHEHDVPVIVDAAAELPPTSNLSHFVEGGADLVAFSGGKAIRGPQSTGILAGKRAYIESVAMQHLDTHAATEVWSPPPSLIDRSGVDGVPRQGIGRPLKVGKEELIGLIRALELFLEEDQDALQAEWQARAEAVASGLADHTAFSTRIRPGGKADIAPTVDVTVDESTLEGTLVELVQALRDETPRVFVGADDVDNGTFAVSPVGLTDAEAEYLVERVLANAGY
jgi:L-seryl-tRNA(Ser) seleniumtransferase